jgi:hypothetical protein
MAKPARHWEKITFNDPSEKVPIRVISDAFIANMKLADGRLLPVLLLDCSSRTDIEDLIKAHTHISTPGDVKTRWGKFSKKGQHD